MNVMVLAARNVRGLWPRYLSLFVLAVLAVSVVGASRMLVTASAESGRARVTESVAQRAVTVTSDREPGGRVLDVDALEEIRRDQHVASAEAVYSLPVDLELPDLPLGVDVAPVRSSVPPPLVATTRGSVFPLAAHELVVPAVIDGRDMRGELGRPVTVGHPRGQGDGSSSSLRSSMTVVGLVDPTWQDDGSRIVYAAPAVTERWFDEASGAVGMPGVIAEQGYDKVTVLAREAADVPGVLQRIQSSGLVAVSLQQMSPTLTDTMTTVSRLTDYGQWLLIGLCTVAAFVVIRSLTVQRTREIGLLKALGHSSGRVTAGLVVEGLGVTWLACIVSVGASAVLANALRGLLPADSFAADAGLIRSVDWGVVLWSFPGAVLVVVLGGALPFLRALRLPAAEALRDAR